MSGVILAVSGWREWDDARLFRRVMDGLVARAKNPITRIVHGAATGTDTMAQEWAEARGIPCEAVPAKWRSGMGGMAGNARNARLASMATHGVAFPRSAESGTADFIAHMVTQGKTGIVYHIMTRGELFEEGEQDELILALPEPFHKWHRAEKWWR